MAESKSSERSTPPVALFQGYNAVTGSGHNTVVRGESTVVAGSSTVSVHLCTDVESLTKALQIDQSLSISYGPIASMSAKMQYVHNLSLTTTSVILVVYASHVIGTETKTSAFKKDDVKVPQTTKDLNDFFRAYGDSYVASVTRGGEYYATYTFYSQTKTEQTNVTASLTASGIYEGVSADTSLQTKISEATTSNKVRMSFSHSITGIENPHLPLPANFIQYALDFPSLPIATPAIIGFTTIGYENLPEIGGEFLPIAKVRRYFMGDGLMAGLTVSLVQLQQLRNSIAFIKDIHMFYGFTDNALTSASLSADKDLQVVHEQIIGYNQNPTVLPPLPDLASLKLGTPELYYSTSQSHAFGGNGGDPFDDLDVNSYLQHKTWISSVKLKTGARVDCISTTYSSQHTPITHSHGGDGGDWQGGLQLQASAQPERIIQISGRSDARVDHLTFTSSGGGQTSGGGDGGNPFDVKFDPPQILLGFRGRNGGELDQIQFVSALLGPVIWR